MCKYSWSHDTNDQGYEPNTYSPSPSIFILGDGNNVITVNAPENVKPNDVGVSDMTFGLPSVYQFMWFDVILALPFDEPVSSTGRLVVDGREYNLVEADDYNALVTLRVEWGNGSGVIDEITIPLSGYYSANDRGFEETASLVVRPRAAASNIDIKNNYGREIDVADINFMSTEANVSYNLFLSASNNPFDSDANGFRFVHSSLGYNDPKLPTNSIGFDVYLNTVKCTGTNSTSAEVYSGSEAVVNGVLPDNSIKISYVANNDTGQADKVDSSWTPVYDNRGDIIKVDSGYSEYEGIVSVVVDTPPSVMLPGRYLEEVYVHIVSEGT